MNMPRNVFVQSPLHEVELTSTSRNGCGNKKMRDMFISGHVTLGNGSCNASQRRNEIARQVAREIAQCNSTFSQFLANDGFNIKS